MTAGIMQPYFFPYIGYWQLIRAVDLFVVCDNFQYTKKGWIRRNRILLDGTDRLISLPLRKGSDYADINERYLSDNFPQERETLLNQIHAAYAKAPQFDAVFPFLRECFCCEDDNLFQFLLHTIRKVEEYLGIDTEIIPTSEIDMDHSLKKQDRVIEMCRAIGVSTYINSIGGGELYDKQEFQRNGVELKFLKRDDDIEYRQFGDHFLPDLSIIDVMMFNTKADISRMLQRYSLL